MVASAFASYLYCCFRWNYGVQSVECKGVEKLRASADAGHGIVLAANHVRPDDPMTINEMCRQAGVLPYFMASWHLFMQSRFQRFMIRRLGCFSLYREGLDRAALNMAIELVEKESRPIVIFPEGYVSRHNEVLNPLNDGVAFIARCAAKKRAAATPASQVVVHPVALRYLCVGEVRSAIEPVLREIEARLSWRSQAHRTTEDRIANRSGNPCAQRNRKSSWSGPDRPPAERLQRLIDALLVPIEQEWLKGKPEKHTAARVIKLRAAVLPDMVQGELSETERARRWSMLADMYLAQQISCYPPDYLAAAPTPERLLETVERYEEDLTDAVRPHPHRVVITVGDAIVVNPERQRGTADPVMTGIQLQRNPCWESHEPDADNCPLLAACNFCRAWSRCLVLDAGYDRSSPRSRRGDRRRNPRRDDGRTSVPHGASTGSTRTVDRDVRHHRRTGNLPFGSLHLWTDFEAVRRSIAPVCDAADLSNVVSALRHPVCCGNSPTCLAFSLRLA